MKRVPVVLLLGAVIALGLGFAQTPVPITNPSPSFILRGKQLVPVPLNIKNNNPALVWWGSYMVNAQGACNACHTCPSYASGHNPYTGQVTQFNATNYLAGGVPFGPFISTNLTPDASGHPAGLTLQQFLTAMHTGRTPSGRIIQVMPWPVFGNMTDHDLTAIYAYLSALPAAQPGTCTGADEGTP